MKLKRIAALLLALVLVFALAACAETKTPEASGNNDTKAPEGTKVLEFDVRY